MVERIILGLIVGVVMLTVGITAPVMLLVGVIVCGAIAARILWVEHNDSKEYQS